MSACSSLLPLPLRGDFEPVFPGHLVVLLEAVAGPGNGVRACYIMSIPWHVSRWSCAVPRSWGAGGNHPWVRCSRRHGRDWLVALLRGRWHSLRDIGFYPRPLLVLALPLS